jgi:hypothetical protein
MAGNSGVISENGVLDDGLASPHCVEKVPHVRFAIVVV